MITIVRIENLNVKSFPSALRIPAFVIESGSAPSNTPWGQMYLQKNGSPMPSEFVTRAGSSITKTIRIIYFTYRKGFNLAVENFLPGILWSRSCSRRTGVTIQTRYAGCLDISLINSSFEKVWQMNVGKQCCSCLYPSAEAT